MNKFKTFLVATLATLALAGCNKSSAPVHEHSYVEVVTKEATCTEAGEKQFVCECGDVEKTEVIPATGHRDTTTEHTAATLDTPAYDTVTCACGESWTENEDAVTVKDVVYAFSTAIGINKIYSASLNDGTPVYYTGGNFGEKEDGSFDASILMTALIENVMPSFDALTAYGDVAEEDGTYYALYTYTSDYTFLVFELDTYDYVNGDTTYIIAQFMGYVYSAQ